MPAQSKAFGPRKPPTGLCISQLTPSQSSAAKLNAAYLRNQAETCRRLARMTFDLTTAERLHFLAADLHAKADEFDDENTLKLHTMEGNRFGRRIGRQKRPGLSAPTRLPAALVNRCGRCRTWPGPACTSRPGLRSPPRVISMMRRAMTSSTTSGWPLSCSSLRALSKASLMARVVAGSNDPSFRNGTIVVDTTRPDPMTA